MAKERKKPAGEPVRIPLPSAPGAPACEMVADEDGIFIVIDGKPVAKRGDANSPQATTWVSIEPGWRVLDGPDGESIVAEFNGVRVH
jgi:hypothetical protein